VINYDGSYVILEWSIPFSEICEGGAAAAGDSVYLSIGAESGAGDTKDADSCYAVSLGDFTYGVSQKAATNHAAFQLSDETIPYDAPVPTPTPPPPPTPTPTPTPPPAPDKDEVKTDENGNEIIVDKQTGETVDPATVTPANNTAPKTGDPMIIMAAVAAVSAAGAFIVRKKRH
ncbi:MAG: LPXTG cell wall anchor domain-containing protein, partial [Clostridia bacterium]|nr:LPXTG cell wall anchor domain-containing protein [Clostridia bacterium]